MAITSITLTQPPSGGADSAAIVAWGVALSGLFSGAGLVPTSDTGQVDWGTAAPAYPTGSPTSTEFAYEVWRFDDSLQATAPIFLRVGYCFRYNPSGSSFFLHITVGAATSGSGSIIGVFTQDIYITSTTAGVSFVGPMPAFSVSDGSSLVLVTAPTTTISPTTNGGAGTFYLDRTRDEAGAPTNEGLVWGGSGHGNSNVSGTAASAVTNSGFCVFYSFVTSSTMILGSNVSVSSGVVMPAIVPTSLASGTTVGFDAPAVVVNQKLLPPILAAVAYRTGDVAAFTPVTLQLSGSNHVYYPLDAFCACADRQSARTTVSLAVRYE